MMYFGAAIINTEKMALNVDKNKCIGCGTCVSLCPKVFKIDDNGKAVVADEKGDTEENIRMAIDSCPVQAISK